MMRSILAVSALGVLSACASTTPPHELQNVGFIGLNCPLHWYVSVEGCTPVPVPLQQPLTECPKGSSRLERSDGVDCVFGSWFRRTSYVRDAKRRDAEHTQSVLQKK